MTGSRAVLLAVLVLLLPGCSYSINGTAVPGAGEPSSASDAPGAPRVARPRTVVGVEPCGLLTEDDLRSIGPFKKEPARKDDLIQESCQYVLDDGSFAGRTVVAALYQKYQDVRSRQPKGHEVVVEGHSAWAFCEVSGGSMACTATLAVNANRSVLVAMTQPGGDAGQMLSVMQPLLKAALNRLPAA
ncbi:DUF3558 family protein [Saccharothrix xinjiangensis]|uniref:DUF3558 family protein n=1 Tax=Saccharothrix xinjiangensis TaxID=204798 RepID=A0ABV9XU94_9PSEU